MPIKPTSYYKRPWRNLKLKKIIKVNDTEYELKEADKTAVVTKDHLLVDVIIPRSIKFKSNQYIITRISRGSEYIKGMLSV